MKSVSDIYQERLNNLLKPFINSNHVNPTINLQNMKLLMKYLNNPDKSFHQIHVAGTSGKTSTCYYLASLISQNNIRVGLCVSPYVDIVSERFQVNFQRLNIEEVYKLFKKYLVILSKFNKDLSYFDLIYSFSIWYFAAQNVDYGVIETGIGGKFDPTNILDSKTKICVITDIGYDHQEILGNTISEIAYQKVGIVKKNNTLITYSKSPTVMKVFKDWTKKVNAKIKVLDSDYNNLALKNNKTFNSIAEYQQKNFNLAFFTYNYLESRDGLKHLNKIDLDKSIKVNIPGRMEEVILDDKSLLVLDGAHNQQKIQTFLNSFNRKYPNQLPAVLIAISQKKDYQKILDELININAFLIVTKFKTQQSMPIKSINVKNLKAHLINRGYHNYLISSNLDNAVKLLLSQKNRTKIVTGSFYLVSQVKKKLNLFS